MIGVDTNLLVRYIVRDDAAQARLATRVLEGKCTAQDPGFVSIIVLVELAWVLGRGYGYDKPVIVNVLSKLLTTAELRVEDAAPAANALRVFQSSNADFADCLIAARNIEQGCDATLTFDRKAAQVPRFSLAT